jgi:hypothetical protein
MQRCKAMVVRPPPTGDPFCLRHIRQLDDLMARCDRMMVRVSYFVIEGVINSG